MDRFQVKTADLGTDLKFEGLEIDKKSLETIYGIPHALCNVDSKFKTDTFKQVLDIAAPTLDLIVKNEQIQVVDPRSTYVEDDQFDAYVNTLKDANKNIKITDSGFERVAEVEFEQEDSDNFLGDLFSKHMKVTRRGDGGLNFNVGLTRLVCTNGQTIKEKEFAAFLRNPDFDTAHLMAFNETAKNFNVNDYMQSLFMKDGEYIPCSLADMMEMQDCLAARTDDDVAKLLFPTARVIEFYKNQSIDVDHLNRRFLDKLPAGMSYYNCFNILTHGAKQIKQLTISDKLAIAQFCRRKKMQAMKDVDLQWNGNITFTKKEIQSWMGDK